MHSHAVVIRLVREPPATKYVMSNVVIPNNFLGPGNELQTSSPYKTYNIKFENVSNY